MDALISINGRQRARVDGDGFVIVAFDGDAIVGVRGDRAQDQRGGDCDAVHGDTQW